MLHVVQPVEDRLEHGLVEYGRLLDTLRSDDLVERHRPDRRHGHEVPHPHADPEDLVQGGPAPVPHGDIEQL